MKFEENLTKLQKNVSDLESPNISLSDGLKIFEEGVKNTKNCLEALNEYKGKITIIKAEMDKIFSDFNTEDE